MGRQCQHSPFVPGAQKEAYPSSFASQPASSGQWIYCQASICLHALTQVHAVGSQRGARVAPAAAVCTAPCRAVAAAARPAPGLPCAAHTSGAVRVGVLSQSSRWMLPAGTTCCSSADVECGRATSRQSPANIRRDGHDLKTGARWSAGEAAAAWPASWLRTGEAHWLAALSCPSPAQRCAPLAPDAAVLEWHMAPFFAVDEGGALACYALLSFTCPGLHASAPEVAVVSCGMAFLLWNLSALQPLRVTRQFRQYIAPRLLCVLHGPSLPAVNGGECSVSQFSLLQCI